MLKRLEVVDCVSDTGTLNVAKTDLNLSCNCFAEGSFMRAY